MQLQLKKASVIYFSSVHDFCLALREFFISVLFFVFFLELDVDVKFRPRQAPKRCAYTNGVGKQIKEYPIFQYYLHIFNFTSQRGTTIHILNI
jgi:hypothetical protein